jgi:hypothetical protein
LLGILTAGLAVDLAFRFTMQARYRAFNRYMEKAGKANQGGAAICAVFVPLALLGAVMIARVHLYLTEDEIVVQRFFALHEQRSPYAGIVQILEARSVRERTGRLRREHAFLIRFAGGGSWSTRDDPSGSPGGVKEGLVQYASKRGGVPVTEVDVLDATDL